MSTSRQVRIHRSPPDPRPRRGPTVSPARRSPPRLRALGSGPHRFGTNTAGRGRRRRGGTPRHAKVHAVAVLGERQDAPL